MKWVLIFFVLGVLFGLAADKYAWVFLIVPVFFFGMSWFLEGMSTYLVLVAVASLVTSSAGIIVGHLLVFRRGGGVPQEG